ncbi:heme-binding domain-containing protein [Aquimarina sp. 2201CG5-10]|uniref:heme-binding domain-containing protein n=1 Tax=Aquimarina callyspongiae TaxID=3098150 RepID=UPI002AB5D4E6|nr:heme-binding domain-containing protein [Aquimarina sp. 2201CG5-10]MDY8137331.1 heme-binding domain-containing protein [Aquimarina sp. 2201CG5-10]
MARTGKKAIFKGRKRKITLLILIILFAAVQFYRPHKNIQKVATKKDFLSYEKAPENVANLIKNSCYDCHSDYTDYYWYDHIAPASWFVDNHIKEGKEHLNLSKWSIKDYRDKRSYLSQMASMIKENKMPLPSYTLVHPKSKLSDTEKQQIIDWLFTIEVKR